MCIKDIVIISMLSLLYCGNNRQMTQETTTGTDTLLFAKELRYIDTIIMSDIEALKDEYEIGRYHVQRMPECVQCSDLERLLILERIVGHNRLGIIKYRKYYLYYYDLIPSDIKGASYLTKKKAAKLKHKLRDVENLYEEKFNVPTPWWWICSVEERIERLEEAIKTDKKYPHYPVVESMQYYDIGKTMAAYEMWFKRPFPECTRITCSEEERLTYAGQALDVGLPYRSKKEDTELKHKLKTKYEKKFKKSIPDYWLSVERVHYRLHLYGAIRDISITRTANGAVARFIRTFVKCGGIYSLKLNVGEWLDLINTLNNLGVSDLEQRKEPLRRYAHKYESFELSIFTLNCDDSNFDQYCVGNIKVREISEYTHILPSDWGDFVKVIHNMQERIEKEGKKNSWSFSD